MTEEYGGNFNIISEANMMQGPLGRLITRHLIRNVPAFYGPQMLIVTHG
jgi:hypothetical protein